MSTVSIATCETYQDDAVEQALITALEPLGGIAAFVKPHDRVFLKVNLLSPAAPDRAVTTHPAVVRALIRVVRSVGGVPSIGDSPAGRPTPGLVKRLWSESGIGAVCEAEGVPLLLLDDDTCRVSSPSGALYGSFTVGRAVVESDVIICVPKLKTHGFMMFTGAVKNMFGVIPGLEKAQFHVKVPDREDFAAMLVDLMLACRPSLAIMDAVVGMEGDGPAGGKPRHIGCLLASGDSLALDVVASAIAGLDPLEVYTNAVGAKRGIGPGSIDDVKVAGADWRTFAVDDFELPVRDMTKMMPRWLAPHLRGWTTAKPVLARVQDCTRCGKCDEICPVDAITVTDKGPQFDRGSCIRCYCCQEVCPPQAIDLRVPPIARLMSRR